MKKEQTTGLRGRLKIGKQRPMTSARDIEQMVKALGGEEEKIIKTSIHYPESLYRKLKVKVAEEGITIRDYVLGLIQDDLEK
ncbi:MAG: hypothetical protein AAF738_01030 [Bacteroidota bacterium]